MEINSKISIEEAIIALEKRKASQKNLLLQQLDVTAESLQPGNLLKSAFSKVTHSSEMRSGLLKTVAGVGLGLLTKKLLIGKSTSMVQKVLSNALKLGVAKTAMNNTDKIKAYGTAIYHNLFKKKSRL